MTEFKSLIAPHLDEYVKFQGSSGGYSGHAESSLRSFDRYCELHSDGVFFLTQRIVDGWCSKRDTESNNSCRARVYPVYDFIKYLQMRKLADVICPLLPKRERCTYIPHAFTEDELKRFFDACDHLPYTKRRPSYNRKMTMPVVFRLLYSTGMRPYEARMLQRDDVDIQHGIISIKKTKNDIQHYIVLHDSMTEILKNYNLAISRLYPKREYFFPGVNKPYHGKIWLTYNFRQIWDSINDSHAIAYDLRHFYGTFNINRWVDQGFDFFDRFVYLSKSMGHSTLESTKYYYSLVPALSEILDKKTEKSLEWILPEVRNEKSE